MVITDNYLIGHIPRTGGHTLTLLYKNLLLPEYQISATLDNIGDHDKHRPFSALSPSSNAHKEYVLTLRRLPSLIMSWMVMCAGRLTHDQPKVTRGGIWPDYQPMPVIPKAAVLDKSISLAGYHFAMLPDVLLRGFLPDQISFAIRLEHFLDDLHQFLLTREHLTVGKDIFRTKATHLLSSTPKQPLQYNKDVFRFFETHEVRRMYNNNPLWSNVERRFYGALLSQAL